MATWHSIASVTKEIVAKLAKRGSISIVKVSPGEKVQPGTTVAIDFQIKNTDDCPGWFVIAVSPLWSDEESYYIKDIYAEDRDTGEDITEKGEWQEYEPYKEAWFYPPPRDPPEQYLLLAPGQVKNFRFAFETPETEGKATVLFMLYAWY